MLCCQLVIASSLPLSFLYAPNLSGLFITGTWLLGLPSSLEKLFSSIILHQYRRLIDTISVPGDNLFVVAIPQGWRLQSKIVGQIVGSTWWLDVNKARQSVTATTIPTSTTTSIIEYLGTQHPQILE